MTDEESEQPAAITSLAHQRGSDGKLLPVEKTVSVRGEGEAELKVYPATSGDRREWKQRLDDAGDQLGDDLEAELFDKFLPYEPDDFGDAESWNDIRPALADALANAIFAELFDSEQDDFSEVVNEALEEVTSGNVTPAE